MPNFSKHVSYKGPPKATTESKTGFKSSSISGPWGVHKELRKETTSGCFSIVIISNKGNWQMINVLKGLWEGCTGKYAKLTEQPSTLC